jgi:hypothetical protein
MTDPLGALLSEHKARIPTPLIAFLTALIFTIAGAFVLSAAPLISIPFFLLALILVVFAGWLYSRSLEIREQGIRYKSLFGEKSWAWNEFDALRFEIRQTSYRVNYIPVGSYLSQNYILSCRHKDLIKLSDQYHNGQKGGQLLMKITEDMFLPRYLAQFQNGETIWFSKRLALSKTGIIQGKKEIPWKAITNVEMVQGALCVTLNFDKYKTIPIQKIPNGHVLAALIATVLR